MSKDKIEIKKKDSGVKKSFNRKKAKSLIRTGEWEGVEDERDEYNPQGLMRSVLHKSGVGRKRINGN